MLFFFVSTFLQNKYKDEAVVSEPEKIIMEEVYSNSEIFTPTKKDGYDNRTYYISFEEDNLLEKQFIK